VDGCHQLLFEDFSMGISRIALILVVAAVLTPATSLRAAEAPRTSVTVRVYQTADLPLALEQRVLAEAEAVLRGALVDVRWRKCAERISAAACVDPPESSELLLRITLEGIPRKDRPSTLGLAIVSRCTGGQLASVYVDRVTTLADEAATDVAVLLGRVAAHELAHLMMRTSVHHARRGLMRPNWTLAEVRRNRAADWVFTAEDVAAIRR
jgi:hypothetical protein